MMRRTMVTMVILTATAATVMLASPGLRTRALQQWAAVGGWTDAARHADPVGFVQYAQRKLKHDLEVMEKTRRELAGEIGQLAQKIHEHEAMAGHAQSLAADFRTQFQLASTNAQFPVEVQGAAYTEAQVRSQVSLLLAEAEGYQQSLANLHKVSQEAESQMEKLAVKISATESQLAALSAKRGLLRARQLTAEGEQLLAQVDQLMTGNAQLIQGNPVRTVRELMASSGDDATSAAAAIDAGRVDAFLAGGANARPTAAPVSFDNPEYDLDDDAPASTVAKPPVQSSKNRKTSKPIFQQF